jgi:hypothetical protein
MKHINIGEPVRVVGGKYHGCILTYGGRNRLGHFVEFSNGASEIVRGVETREQCPSCGKLEWLLPSLCLDCRRNFERGVLSVRTGLEKLAEAAWE